MCSDKNVVKIFRTARCNDEWGMLKPAAEIQLDEVPRLYFLDSDFPPEWANALISDYKVIKVPDSAPSGAFTICVDIIPPQIGCIIHYGVPAEYAL